MSDMHGPLPRAMWKAIVTQPEATKRYVSMGLSRELSNTMPYMMDPRNDAKTGEECVPDPTAFDRLGWYLVIDYWLGVLANPTSRAIVAERVETARRSP